MNIFNSDSDKTTATSPLESQEISTIGESTDCRANNLTGFQESFLIEVLRNIITTTFSSNDATSVTLNKNKWWSHRRDLNPRPADYKSAAQPG